MHKSSLGVALGLVLFGLSGAGCAADADADSDSTEGAQSSVTNPDVVYAEDFKLIPRDNDAHTSRKGTDDCNVVRSSLRDSPAGEPLGIVFKQTLVKNGAREERILGVPLPNNLAEAIEWPGHGGETERAWPGFEQTKNLKPKARLTSSIERRSTAANGRVITYNMYVAHVEAFPENWARNLVTVEFDANGALVSISSKVFSSTRPVPGLLALSWHEEPESAVNCVVK